MYPVTYAADYVEPRNRLTTFFRLILAIPQLIWGIVYAVVAFVVIVIAWFALLFTARYPQGLYDFVANFVRWQARLGSYLLLVTDRYPDFVGTADVDSPVHVAIAPPAERYNRWKTFFRFILMLPVHVILGGLAQIWEIFAVLAWVAIVILGRQPRGFQELLAFCMRYQTRANGYLYLLTEQYPWIETGDAGPAVAPSTSTPPAPPAAPGPVAP